MSAVLAVLEQRDGALKQVSHEVVTAARAVADALGAGMDAIGIGPVNLDATAAARYGAEEIVIIAADAVRLYQPHLYVRAVAERAKAKDYKAIVLGATALGKDLGPRLAARLGCPFAADVTAVGTESGSVTVSRPVYAGRATYRMRVTAPQCVIAVRPNSVTPVEQPRTVTLQRAVLGGDGSVAVARTVSIKAPAEAKLDVAEAAIVVSGGRGLKEPANFQLLEELAQALGGAAIGASRAVVDAGWRPHAEQVGQTGTKITPELYLACGISGAIQHIAGCASAKHVVAVNKDPGAPILAHAEYAVIGDLHEVIPALVTAIRARGAST